MIALNEAETAFLTAAAKTYAALKIANPLGTYSSTLWVTLNIDGVDYQCRCDCTGVIQTIIRVLGYEPNWGTSSVPGHTGDGWYLTDATASFVQDMNGNISEDWVVLPFDSSDARPGDIRASSTHSHCDIFVDYVNANAYGLNAGSGPNTGGQAIPKSCQAGVDYMESGDPSVLAATWTIQDNEAAKVLRYVRNAGSTDVQVQPSIQQSLKSLDVQLKFLEKVEFEYSIRNAQGEFIRVVPGYLARPALHPTGSASATDMFGDSWIEFVPNYVYRYTNSDSDAEWRAAIQAGLIMLYTLVGGDPLLTGRTVILHEDGTNDYESSKGYVPIIRTQFPVHFRCVLVDFETRTHNYGRSSAFLTNNSADSSDANVPNLIKAYQQSRFLYDASGRIPESYDKHGYLFLNDYLGDYEKEEYTSWIRGREEE